MEMTIKSRILATSFTFSRPGNSYIYVDMNNEPGVLGTQICKGGRISGSTISYEGEDHAEFTRICWHWYRAYVSNCRNVQKGC